MVATAASAMVPTPMTLVDSEIHVAPREVRIEVVSNSVVEEEQVSERRERVPVKRRKAESDLSLKRTEEKAEPRTTAAYSVPFYSQFADISAPSWQKVGCGIASLAMVIDFYTDEEIESVDTLLNRGIAARAFLSDAGWIHSGLISLSNKYGLSGETKSFYDLSVSGALDKLGVALEEGPVIASVHYTFEPTNPIPHLVVITGMKDGLVYYNDPAEPTGGGTLTVDKFSKAWKKRYIEIRPV